MFLFIYLFIYLFLGGGGAIIQGVITLSGDFPGKKLSRSNCSRWELSGR